MSKVRVVDLAKEIGQKSKEVVDYLREQGYEVTNHLSEIDEKEQNVVRAKFAPDSIKEKKEDQKPQAKENAPKKAPKKKRQQQVFDGRSPEVKARAAKEAAEREKKKGLSVSLGDALGKKAKEATESLKKAAKNAAEAGKEAIKKDKTSKKTENEASKSEKASSKDTNVSTEKVESGDAEAKEVKAPKTSDKPKEKTSKAKAVSVEAAEKKEEEILTPEEAARRYAEKKARQVAAAIAARGGNKSGKDGNGSRDGKGKSGDRNGRGRNGNGSDRDRNGNGNGGNRNGRTGVGDKDKDKSFSGRGNSGKDGARDERGQRGSKPQGGGQGRPQGKRAEAGGERLVTKSTNNRERDKEREREKNRERDKNEKSFGKHFDKNKVLNELDDDREKHRKKKDPNRKGAFIKPEPVEKKEDDGIKNITIPESLTIQELAEKMKVQPSVIIKKLFLEGKMYTLTQEITYDEAADIALEFNVIAEKETPVDLVAELLKEEEDDPSTLKRRPPVVCVMGHVDHGKTSLLDAIRSTNITSKEAGGITQRIGASIVEINGRKITFLDTPGHEAFTAMRLRGAMATDIAVLVVAADDGVMPQTVEAINHAKAAGVEIIVAVNKIDKPGANIDRVKQELTEYGLIAEDWGGSTTFVPVSAKTHEGIDQLLEMILLTADVNEYKANPDRAARGVVIEASLDKGRGPVATVLVQKGTLHVGDYIAIGHTHGKVRAMLDDKHKNVKSAGPSIPVEILGLDDVPNSGDTMLTFKDEKEARNAANVFITEEKSKLIADSKQKLSLDGLFDQIKAGNVKELDVIIKADVQGSVEAIKQSLIKLNNDEVAINVIHGGVGAINESDISLAAASNAIVIGFNVRPDPVAKESADREKVDVRLYKVIYNIVDDITAAMNGMLEPEYVEQVIGHAEVRQLFKASGVGTIAGSFVLDGKIVRGCKARVKRGDDQIFEGNLASLKRFKDDVKEVNAGYECGLVFEKFNDLAEGDTAEFYQMVEVPRNK